MAKRKALVTLETPRGVEMSKTHRGILHAYGFSYDRREKEWRAVTVLENARTLKAKVHRELEGYVQARYRIIN